MVTMHVEIMLGLLLFFAWAQNFSKRALAWWGSAHLMRAVSIMLLGLHGSVPDSLSIDFANAVLFGSFALTWCGARVFDRRSPEPALALIGVAIWLLACRLQHSPPTSNCACWSAPASSRPTPGLAAYEFWRGRDEALVSRWPAIFMLFAHGALFLLRTPLGAVAHVTPGNSACDERLARTAQPRGAAVHHLDRLHPAGDGQGAHRVPATAPRRAPTRSPASPTAAASWSRPRRRSAPGDGHASRPRCCCSTSTISRSINDQYGHAVGDRTLQIFADIAKAHIGDGRHGRPLGRRRIRRRALTTPAARSRRPWRSASRSRSRRRRPTSTAAWSAPRSAPAWRSARTGRSNCRRLLLQADQALYRAKDDGRNRIAIATPESLVASGEHEPPNVNKVIRMGRRSAA